ncbi:hypothetical protein PFICI_06339 [Pestalotiopsis fici W106-1]|uniref:DNA endonuclease activator Ctp1 C-terminal domain-containing protein n=1 Tax=Pestalotiopsis fici (strain W106-1 / CGMCC3.15140) TaxID=1229662 RepID=W3X7H8_PESFW|nr:uncharacterized protein PFICI_06339 [Pestalotiopsis fici W106-1]ETS81337.1 hypothetical protein PFICI_06339 [Pestalotiopsis fici W106-1]
MENWLQESGRSALFDALGEAWNRIDSDYRSACHAENVRVAGLDGEIKILKARVAQVEWLEQKNKALREELEQLKRTNQKQQQRQQHGDDHGLLQSQSEPRTPLAPKSVNQLRILGSSIKHGGHPNVGSLGHDELVAEYGKLEEKNHKLRGQVSITLEANETLQKQFREKNQACEKWVQYAKTLEAQSNARKQKIERLKARLASMTPADAHTDTSFTSETSPAADEVHNQAETSSPNLLPIVSRGGTNREPLPFNRMHILERTPSLPPLPTAKDAAAVTLADQTPSKEPSSDTPVVVSERCVRKRRHADQPSTRTPATTRIKLEEGSDPVVTSEQCRFMAHDSVDFDNADDRVVTPRKSRHFRSPSPTIIPAVASAVSETADVPQHDGVVQRQEPALPNGPTTEANHNHRLMERSSALLPYNHPRPSLAMPKPVRKAILRSSLREGIASLAEDGNAIMAACSTADRPEVKAGRLAGLLNNPAPPEKEAIHIPWPWSASPLREATTFPEEPFEKRKKRKLPSEWQLPNSESPKTPTVSNKETPPAGKNRKLPPGFKKPWPRREEVPLRDRPVESLNRADFKLNPKYNEGYNYAYNEVVRGKDRAALPGCSKEECCGKLYRPLAELELAKTMFIDVRNDLEAQLGDDAWKLSSMMKAEMEKLWVDTKIREISQKYGRHRERHSAMQEPPGWDRVGFPSTQEEAEDREKAKRLELEEVQRRHNEALKKGKYLFRDEEP